jgi:hypothetical protein
MPLRISRDAGRKVNRRMDYWVIKKGNYLLKCCWEEIPYPQIWQRVSLIPLIVKT